MQRSYLDYAMSVIVSRALPDVRDGLKPVHRRILYASHESGYHWNRKYVKSARPVADVMGKYHPHGDASIYDALVRMAQDWSLRVPLIDGQGNFGSIDGDPPAAMRYTESRLTKVAHELLEDIDKETVDFQDTYDASGSEPKVLPARFPNLLVNGSGGIAVGMATNIPPHNLAEVCNGAIAIIDNPAIDLPSLMEIVPGPDFPTGGIIVDSRTSILEAYETGRGGFRVRSKWGQEDQGRGTWSIVVTEIPYGVQKARLIEKIAELLMARKLPLLEDIRDESAEDIRIVLVPKSRTVDPGILMESLFKLTELESRFPLNMNVLSRGKVPNVLSLKGVLKEWLDHRRDVLIRRSKYRLGEIEKRLEILAGYLIAYLNIDEVIRIIREEDEPKQVMMARWSLTDNQAEAILNMRLRALRKLEEIEIRKEFDGLTEEKKQIEALLASDAKQWAMIKWQVAEIRKKFGPETDLGRRRTQFADAPEHDLTDIAHAMIEREPVTVVVSEKGWLRAMKGHLTDHSQLAFKEGDSLKLAFHAQTTDKILVFTTGGKFYTIGADRLPGGRGHGEPIRIIVDMENDQDIVTAFVHDPKRKLLLVSYDANGFVVSEEEVVANTRKGKQVMNVKAPDEAKRCVPVAGDHLAIVGENRKMLIFPLAEIPEMARGKGVRLQKYKDGGVLDLKTFTLETGLSWQDSADRTFTRSREELAEWIGARAAAGRMVPK
ncbi:MAG: DNA topoisomerase IV subunit A, partial [Mesorhizobium sp.]